MTFFGALQAFWALEKRVGITPGLSEAIDLMRAIKHENNSLRRSLERSNRAGESLAKTADELRAQLVRARRHARTCETMAAHWRLQAKGGDYDATKEESP